MGTRTFPMLIEYKTKMTRHVVPSHTIVEEIVRDIVPINHNVIKHIHIVWKLVNIIPTNTIIGTSI